MKSLKEDLGTAGVREYTLDDLRIICNKDFIAETLYGEVYKGVTEFEDEDGMMLLHQVTVKTWGYLYEPPQDLGKFCAQDLKRVSFLNKSRFRNEVSFLMKFSGNAIPKLFGYCYDENSNHLFAVVYDFTSRDTMYNLITHAEFTWELRIQAAHRLACTLELLHGQRPAPYKLCILASANVMLDLNWSPILFDFSIITSGAGRDSWQALGKYLDTSTLTTFTCFNDSYTRGGLYFVEGDVFSFGSVLLELISKQTFSTTGADTISQWAEQNRSNQGNCSLADSSFVGDIGFSAYSAASITEMAMQCVKSKPRLRPSMKEVVKFLGACKSLTNDGDDFDKLLKASEWIPSQDLRKYSLKELETLIGNFSKENSVGDTHFGRVYRGIAGVKVVVKTWGFYGAKQRCVMDIVEEHYNWFRFKNEITFLTGYGSGCHHCVPKLNGYYCEDNDDMMAVVYDFELRDTLLNLITADDFGWTSRINVALNLAHLLEDLHSKDPPYSVCNLDPANVMLDKGYKPVIFDFSLIPSEGGVDKLQFVEGRFPAGGRCAKSRWQYEFSMDDDVYSFGLMLMALISKCFPPDYSWAHTLYVNKRVKLGRHSVSHVSFTEGKGYNASWAAIITEMAMICIVGSSSMKEVIEILEPCHHFMNHRSNTMTYYEGASDRVSRELPCLQKLNFADWSSFAKLYEIHKTKFELVYLAQTKQGNVVTVKSWSGNADLVSSILDLDICILSIPEVRRALGRVKLIGYYSMEECKDFSVVYDFQAKGILQKFISEDSFTWSKRFAVALHIAKSLEFLHGWKPLHLVCDISLEHIMLDLNFNPILCHFSLPINGDVRFISSLHPIVNKRNLLEETNSFGDLLWSLISKSLEKMKESENCISIVDKCFSGDSEYDSEQGKLVAELARSCKFDEGILKMTTIVARLSSVERAETEGAQNTEDG